MSLSKRCVSNNSSSTADQIPGSRPPLWKKGAILGPTPFPPGQVADDNSDYTLHSQTLRGVFRALSQRSCFSQQRWAGFMSYIPLTMVFIKVIVVTGPWCPGYYFICRVYIYQAHFLGLSVPITSYLATLSTPLCG